MQSWIFSIITPVFSHMTIILIFAAQDKFIIIIINGENSHAA